MAQAQGHRLREARIHRGFASARAASQYFGWSEHSYSQHERGLRGLRIETAKRYAKAFRVSYPWLVTGEGSPGWRDGLLSNGGNELISVSSEVLREAFSFVLRAQGVGDDLAAELSNIAVGCLAEPPIVALQSDPVRSFQVRFELGAQKSEHPTQR